MPKLTGAFSPSEPDAVVLERLALVVQVCVAFVTLLVLHGVFELLDLAGALGPLEYRVYATRWPPMTAASAIALVLGLLSYLLSDPRRPPAMRRAGTILAGGMLVFCAAVMMEERFHFAVAASLPLLTRHAFPLSYLSAMGLQSATTFTVLGAALMLIRMRKRFAARMADLVVSGLVLAVMTIDSGFVFGTMPLFGRSAQIQNSPETLLCLSLLTVAVVIRRAEFGVFSIFLGQGMGSRAARLLSPLVLLMPFLREAARAHFLNVHRMPPHYTTAILASLTAIVALALVLYLAWRINGMEREIHDLSLRDALTGLYNLRGFYLLAEQSLRVARRSHLPFSVLFIDLDNLKQTNDQLGHQTGSQCLQETGELLRTAFREIDIVGRIGGDEFAIAGHFDHASILLAADRIRDLAARRNGEGQRRFKLSFSVGCVTADHIETESLEEMLAQADREMYQEKRHKKLAAG
ncbi:MAG TPA: GGDEF domain-containing protein [Terracidiphilus sp.]|nr:GGDEF domain-containing protein [Terracidiphilus sp.]